LENNDNMKLCRPEKKYAKQIYKLVQSTKILDLNSEYLYLLQTTHFRDYCSIALHKEKVVGFVSGYCLPNRDDSLFIWQVAVDDNFRGKGLAKNLMIDILSREENLSLKYIHTTISPSNKSSIKAFERFANELETNIVLQDFIEKDDFINQHEEEVLSEIGPFNLKGKSNANI
jgi:L-2,4-diaminobutyric acid acetyltransferase